MLKEAREYLLGFRWCREIKREFFGFGIGDVVAVFLIEFTGSEGADDILWVVGGDLPSAYLVTDRAGSASAALDIYCDLMQQWIDIVRAGGDNSCVFPITAEPTDENADALARRVQFLREEILPTLPARSENEGTEQLPSKDEHGPHPVATRWRATLEAITRALAERDYALSRQIPRVAPVSPSTARQIEGYVADYGEDLVELPPETWQTSEALWTGSRWDAYVDLWTAESGASDMVLYVHVFDDEKSFRVEVRSVYVP